MAYVRGRGKGGREKEGELFGEGGGFFCDVFDLL